MYQQDKKGFFRILEGEESHEVEMPEMKKIIKFWGGIWGREERRPNMRWMEEIRR